MSGTLFAGDVAGRSVLIADDMIVSGGTMLRAAEASVKAGARDVHLVAAHALLDAESAQRLREAPVKTVILSDTVPLASNVAQILAPKLKTVPCHGAIARAMATVLGKNG